MDTTLNDASSAVANVNLELANVWQSERLVYRSVTADDADVAFMRKINSDPVTVALSGGGLLRPYTQKSAKSLVEALEKALLAVMVCLPPSGGGGPRDSGEAAEPTPIGFVCLSFGGDDPAYPTPHNRHAPLGIAIASAYQGQGYGPEAIKWALNWAFRFANLHSVSLQVMEYNERAKRVYERVGFVYEGKSREVVFCGDRYWDSLHYSILDREWKAAATSI